MEIRSKKTSKKEENLPSGRIFETVGNSIEVTSISGGALVGGSIES